MALLRFYRLSFSNLGCIASIPALILQTWALKTRVLKTLVLIFLAIVHGYAFANQSAELSPIDDCSFSGGFEQQKQIIGLSEPLISNGVLFFHCDFGVIWKSTSPITQALIVSSSNASFRVEDGQITKLKSRQSKMLGSIISGFISGDLTQLKKQFSIKQITEGSDKHLLLLPNRKRLKRALQKIEVESTSPRTQTITITDVKGQNTVIVASKTLGYSSASIETCQALANISDDECGLLLKDLEPKSNVHGDL